MDDIIKILEEALEDAPHLEHTEVGRERLAEMIDDNVYLCMVKEEEIALFGKEQK
jgi:hypothetical protein